MSPPRPPRSSFHRKAEGVSLLRHPRLLTSGHAHLTWERLWRAFHLRASSSHRWKLASAGSEPGWGHPRSGRPAALRAGPWPSLHPTAPPRQNPQRTLRHRELAAQGDTLTHDFYGKPSGPHSLLPCSCPVPQHLFPVPRAPWSSLAFLAPWFSGRCQKGS